MQNSALKVGKATTRIKTTLNQAKQKRDHITNPPREFTGYSITIGPAPTEPFHHQTHAWNSSRALVPRPQTTRHSSPPRCNCSQIVETRPRGSAQPEILCLFFCCFQEGFSPNKSFRKSHSEFRGSIQPPSPLVRALERFAVTTGLCQMNKPQLVAASMQKRPATPYDKEQSRCSPYLLRAPPSHRRQTHVSSGFSPATKQLQ